MDPSQLKASYDQMQFLSDKISNLDKDLFNTQNHQNVEGLKSQQQQTQNILDSQERAQYANENRQNRNFTLLSDGVKDQGSGVRDSIYRTNAMTNDYVKTGTGDVKDSVYRTSAITNDYVKSGTGDVKDSVYRTNAVTNDYVKTGNADNLLATERTAAKLDQEIYRINSDIDQNIYRSQTAINDAISTTRIEAQKNTNELIGYMKTNNDNNWSNFGSLTKDVYQGKAETILSGTNQYALLAKQVSDNSAIVQIEALKSKADLYKQASENTAAIQLEAMKNKADLSKQMAFEYSSLKDKIFDSESNIKDVLRDQESCRLRDVLRATEHKSLYFELKNNHRRRHH